MLEFDRHPDDRKLRWFAALLIGFGAVVAWIGREFLAANGQIAVISVSTAVGVAGLLSPRLIRPLYVGWMAAAYPIGWLVSHALLAVVYFCVLTPIALVLRRRRDEVFPRRFDRNAETYWMSRRNDSSIESYFRQF